MIEQSIKHKKRMLDPVATRAKILTASTKLFSEQGYDSVSFAQIAMEAGLPKSLVAYHFGSKDELWAEVTSILMKPGMEAMDRFLAGEITVGDLLMTRLKLLSQSPTRSRFIAWVSLTRIPMPRPLQERRDRLNQKIHEVDPETRCRCLLAISLMDGWYLNKNTYALLMGEDTTSLISEERMQSEIQKLLRVDIDTFLPETQP